MELNVKKGNILNDYSDFIQALDIKFKFKDRFEFEKEFLDFIETINKKGNYDADALFDKFVNLLLKHGNAVDIQENAMKAVEEIKIMGSI